MGFNSEFYIEKLETYRLALQSIVRWADSDFNDSYKVSAIQTVAETALEENKNDS